ncbi:MAG: 2TM domain-containing protein [Oscillatoriales cyanobacterium SM2_2_1]|nr:2TM domain-containing protein [Oscillatoriales cyanobacterium SM2_2_1]
MPKLSKPPDPRDPEYQNLERRINLALHLAIYAASCMTVWFGESITYSHWGWAGWSALFWGLGVVGHGLWVWQKNRLNPVP